MRLPSLIVIGGLFALCALPMSAWAESASENYILWGEAITSGGNRSTSTNYINYGSVGDTGSENRAESDNYRMYAGFEAIYEDPILRMNISTNSIELSPNPMTADNISSGQTVITVSTNADFGYGLTVTELSAFQNHMGFEIADVTDGAVTAGVEEFGIAVSGTDAAFGDDRSVSTTPRVIATRDIWTTGVTTTLTFKAAVAGDTRSGYYSGTVSIIATGLF